MNGKIIIAAVAAIVLVASVSMIFYEDQAYADGTPTFSVDGVSYDTWSEASSHVNNGSQILLTSSGFIDQNVMKITADDVTLDLNGNTLTINSTSDSISSGLEITAEASLTIIDSSSDGTGTIKSTASNVVLVVVRGDFTLNSGNLVRDVEGTAIGSAVQVNGSFVMNGGKILVDSVYKNSSDPIPTAVLNKNSFTINGGEIHNTYGDALQNSVNSSSKNAVIAEVNGGALYGGFWGATVFGYGVDDNGSVDNTLSTLTINGGLVIAIQDGGQAIGTNASGGKNAGHTITINGGSVSAPKKGTGIYAPSYGLYNINGGSVYGELQGVRISAGILNISGNAMISSDSQSTIDQGIVAGGSGGASGTIVAGKASSGYWGNLEVNITGGSISNNAKDGDAIVVSDVFMGSSDYGYTNFHIKVNVEGGNINGDIQNITSKTQSLEGKPIESNQALPAKGNASINLNGGSIVGDIHQSSEGSSTNLNGALIDGSVYQTTNEDDSPGVEITGGIITGELTGVSDHPSPATVTLVIFGDSMPVPFYGGSFVLPYVGSSPEGYVFLGWSTDPNSTVAEYADGSAVHSNGDITLYAVLVPENYQPPQNPDDDEEFVPPYIPQQSSGDDDTTLYIACCAAAAVVALLAIIIVMNERKR